VGTCKDIAGFGHIVPQPLKILRLSGTRASAISCHSICTSERTQRSEDEGGDVFSKGQRDATETSSYLQTGRPH
jgi:hypothetical protein